MNYVIHIFRNLRKKIYFKWF